jgi:hypothetical protein
MAGQSSKETGGNFCAMLRIGAKFVNAVMFWHSDVVVLISCGSRSEFRKRVRRFLFRHRFVTLTETRPCLLAPMIFQLADVQHSALRA